MAPELHPDVWRGQENFQTNLTMPNKISSLKCSLKSVLGLADVGLPHGEATKTHTKIFKTGTVL